MSEYQQHTITVVRRNLPTPWGGVVPADQYPFRIGATFKHWANVPLFMAHVREALRLLANMDPALDAVPNFSDERATARQARLQFGFLMQVAKHISYAYNAAGVLWYNDPDHRVIFRKYLAGSPLAVEGNNIAIYGKAASWGGTRWYQPNEEFPLVPAGSVAGMGILPQQTRDLLNRFYKPWGALTDRGATHRIQFVQQFSFVVSPQDSEINDRTIANVYNAGSLKNGTLFSWNAEMYECTNVMAEPWSSDDQTREDRRCFVRPFHKRVLAVPVGSMPAGYEVPYNTGYTEEVADWRMFMFDQNMNAFDPHVNLRVAPPLRSYLPYLAEVAESLNARSAYEVIQDARAFPVFNNEKTFEYNNNGDRARTIADAIVTQADILQQQAAGSAELRSASQITQSLVTTVGAALPFPANLVAMFVGLGANVIMSAINGTLVKGRIRGHGRDDVGRYKLLLDPQVLYRDINASTAPAFPDPPETIPSGFTQPSGKQAFMARLREMFHVPPGMTIQAFQNAIRDTPRIERQESSGSGMTIVAGLAALGALYYASTRGPSPYSTSTPTSAPRARRSKAKTRTKRR